MKWLRICFSLAVHRNWYIFLLFGSQLHRCFLFLKLGLLLKFYQSRTIVVALFTLRLNKVLIQLFDSSNAVLGIAFTHTPPLLTSFVAWHHCPPPVIVGHSHHIIRRPPPAFVRVCLSCLIVVFFKTFCSRLWPRRILILISFVTPPNGKRSPPYVLPQLRASSMSLPQPTPNFGWLLCPPD